MKNIELLVSDNSGAYRSESNENSLKAMVPCKCSELFIGDEGYVDIRLELTSVHPKLYKKRNKY